MRLWAGFRCWVNKESTFSCKSSRGPPRQPNCPPAIATRFAIDCGCDFYPDQSIVTDSSNFRGCTITSVAKLVPLGSMRNSATRTGHY